MFLVRAPNPEMGFRAGALLGLLSYFWVFLGFIGGFALIPVFVWVLASLSCGMVSYLTVASFPLVSPYLAPFLFPLLLTAINILLSFGPWGIWNQQSISLSTWSLVSPLAGVFGVHGYSFTIALIAVLLAMGVYGSIPLRAFLPSLGWIFLIFTLGSINEITARETGKSIKVATVSLASTGENSWETALKEYAQEIKLLAEKGARIIVIPEGSFYVNSGGKNTFLEAFRAIARQLGVVLVAGYIDEEEKSNKAGVFTSEGEIYEYRKRYPVFLAETSKRGKSPPLVVETPYGKLGVIICHDDAFPRFVRRAKLAGAELLAVPSFDWYQVHRQHSGISLYTSALFGLPVIRATGQGISQVVTAGGKILVRANDFEEKPALTLVDLPLSSYPTLYSFLGESVSYALLLGALGVVFWWAGCTWFS
ncbi:MAG: nitrilase-related carbon-nitrogen hydrolase [bacterium JZ-2024 1]